MRRAAVESGGDVLADSRGIERTGYGQQNQVHQIFDSRVRAALPRQSVGVQFLGELFFFARDGGHFRSSANRRNPTSPGLRAFLVRFPEHVTGAHVKMNLSKPPSPPSAASIGVARAPYGVRVQVHRRFANDEFKAVLKINSSGILQQIPNGSLIPLSDSTRQLPDGQINVARCSRRLNAEFHCVAAFEQPRRIRFAEKAAQQTVEGGLAAQTVDVSPRRRTSASGGDLPRRGAGLAVVGNDSWQAEW